MCYFILLLFALRAIHFCFIAEATSALDTESERVVQNALDKLMELKSMTTFGKWQVILLSNCLVYSFAINKCLFQ